MKITIGVISTVAKEKYRQQLRAAKETWVQCAKAAGIEVYFFAGNVKSSTFPDLIYLEQCGEDYNSAFSKQFFGISWLYQHIKADYYCIIGLDTYIHIPNLLKYLNTIKNEGYLYLGGHGYKRYLDGKYFYYHDGGAGFILNHLVLEKIADKSGQICSEWPLLCKDSPKLLPACDVAIAYYLNKWNLVTNPQRSENFYMCNYRGYFKNKKCCTPDKDRIITCHWMEPIDMIKYHDWVCSKPNLIGDNWTIVTAIYGVEDINRYRNDFILDNEYHKVIFCDPKYQAILETFSLSKRLIISKPLEEFKTFNTPDFIKFEMMSIIATLDPWITTHFAWANLGLSLTGVHNPSYLDSILSCSRNRFSIALIHYDNPHEDLFSTLFFTAERSLMIKISDLLINNIENSDLDTLLLILFEQYPQEFYLYYGQVLTNYLQITELGLNIYENIVKPSKLTALDLVVSGKVYYKVVKKLKYALKEGYVNSKELIDLISNEENKKVLDSKM